MNIALCPETVKCLERLDSAMDHRPDAGTARANPHRLLPHSVGGRCRIGKTGEGL